MFSGKPLIPLARIAVSFIPLPGVTQYGNIPYLATPSGMQYKSVFPFTQWVKRSISWVDYLSMVIGASDAKGFASWHSFVVHGENKRWSNELIGSTNDQSILVYLIPLLPIVVPIKPFVVEAAAAASTMNPAWMVHANDVATKTC